MRGVALILAACKCTAPTMLVAGVLVCGACHAAITAAEPRSGIYTTDPHAPPSSRPRGWSPRRLREYLAKHRRDIAGVKREGGERGRGVVWTVPAEAFHAHVERSTSTKTTAPTTSTPLAPTTSAPSNVLAFDPDRAITRAGYRTTR